MSLSQQSVPASFRSVSLEGIGAENAITAQRAVESYGDASDPLHGQSLEVTRMLLRSEIRAELPSGETLMTALADDEAAIMQDVQDSKVLGQTETAFADEKAYELAAPETNRLPRATVKYMARSLRLMQLGSEGPEQLSAEQALASLQSIEGARRITRAVTAEQNRWTGGQLIRASRARIG